MTQAQRHWSDARSEMLMEPGVVYLNSGSFGPLPRPVFDRVCGLRQQLASNPTDFMLRQVPHLLWRARVALGEFVGAQPSSLLFTSSVSAAVSLVANSISVRSPGEVLLTDHEYPTMRWCWERAARRLGLGVRTVRLPQDHADADRLFECLSSGFSERTRIFFFSHVLASTGTVLPVRALCAAARARGIVTVVDGAHAPGLLPLALEDLSCDFYAGSGHKWLLAPAGVGFLYGRSLQEHPLEPLTVSWGCGPTTPDRPMDEPDRYGSTTRLRRLECEGTRDICPWLAVPDAIDFRERFGGERIARRMAELHAYLVMRLAALDGWTLKSSGPGTGAAGIAAFRIPAGIDPEVLRDWLWKGFRVEVGVSASDGHALLRACAHFFNTEEDIDVLADALVSAQAGSNRP